MPQRLNRRVDAAPPGSVNPVTGKATLGSTYAARTINHQLSVLFGFYEWACAAGLGALRSHRDRALVSFWLSSGARATELLGLCHGTDLDAGANTITVVSKGSRLREAIPASVDSFVWLALYLQQERPPIASMADPCGGPGRAHRDR